MIELALGVIVGWALRSLWQNRRPTQSLTKQVPNTQSYTWKVTYHPVNKQGEDSR